METGQEPCGALQACRAGLAGAGGLGLRVPSLCPPGPAPSAALGAGSALPPSMPSPPAPRRLTPRGFSRSRHGAVGRQEVPRLSQHLREKSSKCEVLGGTPPRKVLQAQQAAPWRRPSLVGAQPLPELSPSGPGLPCLKTLCRPGPFPRGGGGVLTAPPIPRGQALSRLPTPISWRLRETWGAGWAGRVTGSWDRWTHSTPLTKTCPPDPQPVCPGHAPASSRPRLPAGQAQGACKAFPSSLWTTDGP